MIPHVNDSKTEKELEEIDLNQLYQYEKQKHLNWYDQVLLNRPLKVVIALLLVAVLAPLLIYHFMFFSSLEQAPSDGFSDGTCVIPRSSRLPCGPGNVPQAECHPQCCYDLNNNLCFHRHPSRFSYIMDREWTEELVLQPRIATVPFAFQNSLPNIRLMIDEVSTSHMTLQFYNSREMSLTGKRLEKKDYSYEISLREMGITVEASQGIIFSTIRGPLIASENIWELAFRLTNETMYGLGELPLRAGTVKVIYNHRGGLSSIPLVFGKVNSSYHGVLIESEAPTEVNVHEDNQVVIRSLTSSGVKLHVFSGPKPSDVMSDAIKVIGVDAQLDYWMLGAHICSESSQTTEEAYADLTTFLNMASDEGLPFESHCGTAPIVFDSACDPEGVKYHENGSTAVKAATKRYVPHVSPYIRYHEENESSSEEDELNRASNYTCIDIESKYNQYMLHNSQSSLYVGSVDNKTFVYPVFENSSLEFMKTLWPYVVELDGIILENSWPLDDSPKSSESTSFIPYFSEDLELAFENTPKLNATRPDGTKYLHEHNTYGNNFESAFRTLFDVEIPAWSTSPFLNGRVKVNRQKIDASWTNLRNELVEAALGGVSGHWSWSSPICGDTQHFDPETQTSLCVKWYMAATYLPFIKIHSSTIPRHPLAFTGTNKNLMMSALNKRLSLLPYFYTTLQSGPLLRPMFYQFPASEHLKDLITQFSVGDDLVIVPNLMPSQTHVHFWIPPGTWYELWGGLKVEGEEGGVETLTTTEADFLTFIRGGSILIIQKDVKATAEATRLQSDLSIIVALDCDTANQTHQSHNTDTDCVAGGTLFITNKISLAFTANNGQLSINTEGNDFGLLCDEDKAISSHVIRDVTVYGLDNGHNNYDDYRRVTVDVDLCKLNDTDGRELVISFLESTSLS